ncbi:hypothetical protein [Secundilactobacillus paracollinoides]|nr:hypothetical protein [Secundilactobacillus paracollinoides]
MITVIFFVGKQYAAWREHGMPGWLDRLIQRFAKVSFGMYLNQIIGLTLLKIGLSHLAVSDLTLMFLIPVGYLFVLGYSFTLAWLCYKVWPLGIFVGRPQKVNPFKRHRASTLVLSDKPNRK